MPKATALRDLKRWVKLETAGPPEPGVRFNKKIVQPGELERRENVQYLKPLIDSYGRRITYLRVSITDRCNFRCIYCVPAGGVSLFQHEDLLTREEIDRFVRVAAGLGVERIRLTGGEPLLRTDILDIVHDIKKIKTIRDLSITTNGSRLPLMVKPLKEAGLDRINVSLDSLNPERFKDITASETYHDVRRGIALALAEGFPVKLNMVVMNGIDEDDIIEFVRLTQTYPLEVRFLEYMPLCGESWKRERFFPIGEVRRIVDAHFKLIEMDNLDDSVAEVYRVENGNGRLGFIASLTESFCNRCSRIRLSSDGRIFPCLFSNVQVSVKELLGNGGKDEEIAQAIRRAVHMKPKGNHFRDRPFDANENEEGELAVFNDTPLIRRLGG